MIDVTDGKSDTTWGDLRHLRHILQRRGSGWRGAVAGRHHGRDRPRRAIGGPARQGTRASRL